MRLVFEQKGVFAAKDAAEQWCRDNGVSFGSSQVGAPRALFRGNCIVSKWRNLSAEERASCDGTMSGDLRDGPVVIELRDLPPDATT